MFEKQKCTQSGSVVSTWQDCKMRRVGSELILRFINQEKDNIILNPKEWCPKEAKYNELKQRYEVLSGATPIGFGVPISPQNSRIKTLQDQGSLSPGERMELEILLKEKWVNNSKCSTSKVSV